MAPATSTKLTYEDYQSLPDDGRRYEIIDGELYVNAAPNTRHQRVSRRLVLALGAFVEAKHLGELFYAPYDVVFSEIDVVQPDIVFISAARLHLITTKNLQGAPDLAIEILSDSNRKYDEMIKKNRYELFGVSEYWIVDPDLEIVKIYRRGAEGFERLADIGPEVGTLTSPLLPGFSLDLREVFAE